jgi:hypothetical protein
VKIIANPDHVHYRSEGGGRRTLCGRYSPIGHRAKLFERHETLPPIGSHCCPKCQQQAMTLVLEGKAKAQQQRRPPRDYDFDSGPDRSGDGWVVA